MKEDKEDSSVNKAFQNKTPRRRTSPNAIDYQRNQGTENDFEEEDIEHDLASDILPVISSPLRRFTVIGAPEEHEDVTVSGSFHTLDEVKPIDVDPVEALYNDSIKEEQRQENRSSVHLYTAAMDAQANTNAEMLSIEAMESEDVPETQQETSASSNYRPLLDEIANTPVKGRFSPLSGRRSPGSPPPPTATSQVTTPAPPFQGRSKLKALGKILIGRPFLFTVLAGAFALLFGLPGWHLREEPRYKHVAIVLTGLAILTSICCLVIAITLALPRALVTLDRVALSRGWTGSELLHHNLLLIKHLLNLRKFMAVFIAFLISREYNKHVVPGDDSETGTLAAEQYQQLPSWLRHWSTLVRVAVPLSFLMFIEKIIIQRIAVYYHYSNHQQRIKANNIALEMLKLLRQRINNMPRRSLPNQSMMHHHRMATAPASIGPSSEFYAPSRSRQHQRILSSDGMISPPASRTVSSATVTERSPSVSIGEDIELDKLFRSATSDPRTYHDLARVIFERLCRPGAQSLTLDDFLRVLTPAAASNPLLAGQVRQLFALLDHDENGDLKQVELAAGIQAIYTEHAVLVRALASNNTVIWQLDTVMTMFVLVFFFTMVMARMFSAYGKMLEGVFTMAMGWKFLIEQPLADAFRCIIYVLAKHPYDVGDRIHISGVNYHVKELTLWSTCLVSSTGHLSYTLNGVLSDVLIFNHRRSPPVEEDFVIRVHSKTSPQQVSELLDSMEHFCKEHQRDYEPGTLRIAGLVIENVDSMRIDLKLTLKSNAQDGALRDGRVVRFMLHLKQALDRHKIRLSPYHWERMDT